MQSLQQEVYIPKNHKLTIQVPENIPEGNIEVFLIFNDKSSQNTNTTQSKRSFGLYEGKGCFKLNNDFKMTEEELLNL